MLTRAQDKTAIALGEALLPCLCGLPPARRQPLALENSSEMIQFKELESATDLRSSFCRPHSPWQGGRVNSNCKCTGEGLVKNLSGSLVV
ncbi:hypothetical protein CAY53_07440 [Desulfobulbus oralis]|uniref:Uncharacterized protein n=1 Tax=Desulfobulbus oralis TaxID=1986146 RepID=A0A2L1GNQ4_9BACT|nr:hypothetical protein CAY53_07440 [Desulfobulbus oralis]